MNSFEGINIEDINFCPDQMNASGIRTRLYYAPDHYFMKIKLPGNAPGYSDTVTIPSGEIEFKGGGWSYIDVLIDENELRNSLSGGQQRKRSKSEIEMYIVGLRAEVLGFIEKHKNTPLIFGIEDSNHQSWIIGNLRNRAFFDVADVSSARKYEDNSGAAIKIICNSPIFLYTGSITQVELSGAFTKGFSLGFKS